MIRKSGSRRTLTMEGTRFALLRGIASNLLAQMVSEEAGEAA